MRRTGKYAYVDGVPCTTSWSFTKSSSVGRYQASCVPDGSAASEGNVDYSGTMTGKGYLPPFPTEAEMAAVFVASAKTGEIMNYEGDILVSETTINIPVAAGGPITWSANWGAQGPLVKETVTAYEDDTRNPAPGAKHGKIEIVEVNDAGPEVWTVVPAVQNITLVFRRGVTTYVDNGYVYREAGNLEADVTFRVENDDVDVALYAENVVKRLRAYVNATQYYLYDAIMFREHSNLTVNRETNEMVGYDVSGWWTALRTRTPPALGTIVKPGSAGVLYPTP